LGSLISEGPTSVLSNMTTLLVWNSAMCIADTPAFFIRSCHESWPAWTLEKTELLSSSSTSRLIVASLQSIPNAFAMWAKFNPTPLQKSES
jgi:hypothetical protein